MRTIIPHRAEQTAGRGRYLIPEPSATTSRGWNPMSDVAFVVLTIAVFCGLALVLRGVERL